MQLVVVLVTLSVITIGAKKVLEKKNVSLVEALRRGYSVMVNGMYTDVAEVEFSKYAVKIDSENRIIYCTGR